MNNDDTFVYIYITHIYSVLKRKKHLYSIGNEKVIRTIRIFDIFVNIKPVIRIFLVNFGILNT